MSISSDLKLISDMTLRLSLEWNDLSQEGSISFESAIKWAQLVNKLQSLDRCLSHVIIDVRSDDEAGSPEAISISSAFFDLKAKMDKRSWESSIKTVF
jgi:hypothetical protein